MEALLAENYQLRAIGRRNKGRIDALDAKLRESIDIAIQCQSIASDLMQRSTQIANPPTAIATETVTFVNIATIL